MGAPAPDDEWNPFEGEEDNAMTARRVRYTLGTNTRGPLTQTAWSIFLGSDEPKSLDKSLLQEWILRFMDKQKDYGDAADDLGAPGQYAELHRKMGKLRRAMWEGKPLVGEPVEEVLQDLIGHCFLALRHMRQGNYGGKLRRETDQMTNFETASGHARANDLQAENTKLRKKLDRIKVFCEEMHDADTAPMVVGVIDIIDNAYEEDK